MLLRALGFFFALEYRIRGQARFSSSIASVLAERESFRRERRINLASAIIISNLAATFLKTSAGD